MTWALQDAKARLSEVMRRVLVEGPQVVTVRGKPTMVVMSQVEYAKLTRRKRRRSLVDLFRHNEVAGDTLDLARSRDTGRRVEL